MKRLFISVLFSLLFINLSSQNNVTITGKVNYDFPDKYVLSEHVFLSYLNNFCYISPENKTLFYATKDSVPDSFSISCYIPYPTPADLQIDKYGMRIFLNPG